MAERELVRLCDQDRSKEDRRPYGVFFSTFPEGNDPANRGRILIEGKDLAQYHPRQGRRRCFDTDLVWRVSDRVSRASLDDRPLRLDDLADALPAMKRLDDEPGHR